MGGNAGGAGMENSGGGSTPSTGSSSLCAVYPLTVENVECLPQPPSSQIAVAVILGSVGLIGYIGIVVCILLMRKTGKARTSSPLPFAYDGR